MKKKICIKCGGEFVGMSKYQQYCKNCNNSKINKREEKMSEQKKSVTEVRVEIAKELLSLLDSKGIKKEEYTKVLSRAYAIAKNEQ